MNVQNNLNSQFEEGLPNIGIFVNLFHVHLSNEDIQIAIRDRSGLSDLRELRSSIKKQGLDASLASVGDKVFGYGKDLGQIGIDGFHLETVNLTETPKLTTRLILDGYLNSLEKAGYTCSREKHGRAKAFQVNSPLFKCNSGGIELFRGVDLQCLYFSDPDTADLVFGILIDAKYAYRNSKGESLNTFEVVKRAGRTTLRQLRIKQGELTPTGKINLEVARQRLEKFILAFVRKRHKFSLPCGVNARLELQPARVILSGDSV